jgi:hypothetical protein
MIENNEPHLEFKFESNSATGMTTITINLNKPQIMFLADCILELKVFFLLFYVFPFHCNVLII